MEHATSLRQQLDDLTEAWRTTENRLADSKGHLAAVEVAEGGELPVDRLGDKRSEVEVVNVKDNTALIHARRDDLGVLRRKITAYETNETPKGRPRNEPLIAPLEKVRDPTFDDVAAGEFAASRIHLDAYYWVELWSIGGRLASEEDRARVKGVIETLAQMSDADGPDPITFKATERDIHLVRLSGEILLDLPKLAPDVYRVARPAEARVDRIARDYEGDLIDPDRIDPPAPQAAAVAILDTGVAEEHPLLHVAIDHPGLSVVPGVLSAIDEDGHGTEMAGLAAFGDLGSTVVGGDRLVPRVWIENLRCKSDDGDVALWAARTEDAIVETERFAGRPRVFNLALSDEGNKRGERTSWSTAIDRLAHNDEQGRLICVAIGNAEEFANPDDYPAHNMSSFLHDPAQAVNAITVGAVTHHDALADEQGRGALNPVAEGGQLSPYTSSNVSTNAAIKPEIVMEGGNACPDGTIMCSGEPDLSVLSLDHRPGRLLAWTWATSAACAAASGLTAEIAAANRSRSPQAIRALLVNSARWTPEICAQYGDDRRDILRAVGYGQPQRDVAVASNRERPTLVLEDRIAPERAVGEANMPMHVARLPLPSGELLALGDLQIELAITLSYFGEPNEARRTKYLGGTLTWDLQRRGETADDFFRRVNDLERPAGEPRPQAAADWEWQIGQQARSRGTVQSDRQVVDAAALAGDKLIAVWPTHGWWADHLAQRRDAEIQYALAITLDAGDADVDLYGLVKARVDVSVDAS